MVPEILALVPVTVIKYVACWPKTIGLVGPPVSVVVVGLALGTAAVIRVEPVTAAFVTSVAARV